MKTSLSDIHKKALLDSLYSRVKSRIKFLGQKRKLIVKDLKKKSDLNKIQLIRANILKE